MEYISPLLESIYATWLSLRSTVLAMEMILAYVCGLGLFLLILPFLESHLSSPPPNKKVARKPQMQMTWQSRCRKKFRTYCRNVPKARGECPKKLKEKGKDGLFLEEMSPEHHLNSLGNMFKSPSAKQDNTTLPSFWNLKEKSEQPMATQKLSYPNILEDHFQQKYNQLFWGLPSLHSESLVAAAWIPQTSSTLPSPFYLFNVISNVYPVQMQDKMSSVLSPTHPLSYLKLRSSPLILSPPQFQPSSLSQAHLQSPLPTLLPSSLPYTRNYGTSCSQSQMIDKPQSLPTEIQCRERPLLTKQLEHGLALPSAVQKPQEVHNVLDRSLSQDWAVSMLPDNFPISCELREKLEKHIQKWLIQHQCDLPQKIQESLEVMHLQNTVTGTDQTIDKPGPSHSILSTGEHKDGQKVRFQVKKESDKNLGPILGNISKDLTRYSQKTPVKVRVEKLLESERNPVICLKSNFRNGSTKHIDKNVENSLKAHLGTKSEQINQGLIPLSVRRSWLGLSNGFSSTDIHTENRNLTSSKSSEKPVSSSEKLVFLDPGTRQALETHVVRFWVKHRWGLPKKILKSVSLLKLKKAESLPILPCDQSSSSSFVHGSSVEVVGLLEKSSQTSPREVLIEDSSSLGSLLLVSSPSCKATEGAQRGIPPSVSHEPSKDLPTKPESRHLSENLTHNLMNTSSQSGTVLERERETQEVSSLPRRTSFQIPEAHNLQAKVVHEFPHNVKTESAGQPQVYTPAVLLPEHSRSMLLPVDTLIPQESGNIVVVKGGNSLVQQKPSSLKHQVSPKGKIKVLAPPYQGEGTKKQSKEKHEERSKFTQVKKKEDNFRNKYHLPLPKTTQVPPENSFQKFVSRFLQWIHPKKTIKGQESPPQKGKPTAANVKIQQQQAKKKPHVDSNVAEAQKLMTAVGQMLEKKMMLQRKLSASKFNQNREAPLAPTSRFSYGHKPASYSEQKRVHSHSASPSCQRGFIQDRNIRGQPPQKNVRFCNEPQIPPNLSLLFPNTTLNLVSSSQNVIGVPGISSHYLHCPRHCVLRRNVCSQLEHPSVFF